MPSSTNAGQSTECRVAEIPLAVTSPNAAAEAIIQHLRLGEPGYVCVASVHTFMMAHENTKFAQNLQSSLMTVPDGKPLSWLLKALGHKNAEQTRGIDLTLELLNMAAKQSLRVGFWGGDSATIDALNRVLSLQFPQLNIVYKNAPPHGTIDEITTTEDIETINAARVDLLFVGLGSPKQEQWMNRYSSEISSVMIGVGAVFDFIAGTKPLAPQWMTKMGLEWLHRLIQEPRRLASRYVIYNSKFIVLFVRLLLANTHRRAAKL